MDGSECVEEVEKITFRFLLFIYSCSMSFWALEILVLSLGVDSPASAANRRIFSLKESLAPSGGLGAVAFSSCAFWSRFWRGSLKQLNDVMVVILT